MFTGIVEEVGEVLSVHPDSEATSISVEAPGVAFGLAVGASVAIDGACLTAVAVEGDTFRVQVVGSTRSRTVAATYSAGKRVNLERALRLGDRLDGHMVQGHVDGVGTLESMSVEGDYRLLTFRVPPDLLEATILHGSITLNGVSLTVNALPSPELVQVAIIPHTLSHTNIGLLAPGDRVNVEGDLIGKYVGKLLAPHLPDPSRG